MQPDLKQVDGELASSPSADRVPQRYGGHDAAQQLRARLGGTDLLLLALAIAIAIAGALGPAR